MSIDYTYTDIDGDKLTVSNNCPTGYISLRVLQGGDGMAAYVAKADAPTVAAELLKAAGQESVIVPKWKSKVVERPSGQMQCGSVTVYPGVDYASLLSSAAAFTALAEYVGSKSAREAAEKAEAEAAEKKLQERRDALAKRFSTECDASQATYADFILPVRKAIDAYIELEDGASRD